MRARLVMTLAAAVMGVMVWAVPATSGANNLIVVVAVVNGTPAGSLELTRTCTFDPPGNATSAPFTASVNPAIGADPFAFGQPAITCTVAVTQAGGMTASFGCGISGGSSELSCGAGNNTVTQVATPDSAGPVENATITVTFNPTLPPTAEVEEVVVAAPTVAAPTTTG